MAIKSPATRKSRELMLMVTNHYISKKFAASWESRRPRDEKMFQEVHTTRFPFKDIWDEFSAYKGGFVFLAKLVRVASAADGWSEEMCEHFGRLAMSLAARAKVLSGECTAKSLFVEKERELFLLKSFYGEDCEEDDWPHCAVIAADYAIAELNNIENGGMLYGHDIDLR